MRQCPHCEVDLDEVGVTVDIRSFSTSIDTEGNVSFSPSSIRTDSVLCGNCQEPLDNDIINNVFLETRIPGLSKTDDPMTVVVLGDGETWTTVDGCKVIQIPASLWRDLPDNSADIDWIIRDAYWNKPTNGIVSPVIAELEGMVDRG